MSLKSTYTERYGHLNSNWRPRLEVDLSKRFASAKHIERISVRVKDIDRFIAKAETLIDGKKKYSDPINQIQDQIAARIVVLYLSDIAPISDIVTEYFTGIEEKLIVPDAEKFGYFGKHFILKVPTEVSKGEDGPLFFELQIKTVFQHSWGEANHDLIYKTPTKLSNEQKRKVAFTAAQAWGADRIFDELYKELNPSS